MAGITKDQLRKEINGKNKLINKILIKLNFLNFFINK